MWRVLAAESRTPARSWLLEALGQLGCPVTFAWRSDEVVERLERERFDLLLLAHRLPGRRRATELLEEIAARWPELPVLYLAGHQPELDRYQPGVNVRGTLVHPCSVVDLQREIQRVMMPSPAPAEIQSPPPA